MPAVPEFRGARWPLVAVAAAAILVYLDALGNAFLWDDLFLVVNNPAIKSWDRLPALFLADLFPQGVLSRYYRPLQAATYLLDYHWWGLNPFGFHLTSVLIHATVAALFYRLALALLADARGALAAALLYAVHPIHTEAVAYVSGRSDPLAAAGMLVALLAFLHDRRTTLGAWRLLSLAAFFLALLAREAAMVLVLLVPLVDRAVPAPRATLARRFALDYLPYAATLAAYLALRHAAVGFGGVGASTAEVPLPLRALTMLKVVVGYLSLLLVPVGQHMERVVTPAASVLDPLVIGAALVVGTTVAAAMACRRTARPVTIGAAWFFLALLPVANLVPLSTFMSEHWLYIPSMGFFLAAGWALARLMAAGWEQPAASVLLMLVAVYGGLTIRRNLDWRDGLTLYQATLRFSPSSVRAWSNLGYAHQEAGQLELAQQAYARALQLQPDAPDVVQNLGVLAAAAGQTDAAQAAYQRAIRMNLDFADPHNNLGNLYRTQGKYDAALAEFRRALAINPSHVSAYNNLGLTLGALGQTDAAQQAFETALRLDPDSAVAHNNLGNLYFRRNDLARAEAEYETAIRLDPDYPDAYNNLGSAAFRRGQTDRAIAAYRRALALNPRLDEVRRNLAIVEHAR